MKKNTIHYTPKLILTGLIAASTGFALAAVSSAQENGASQFSMFVDGRFGGGISNGLPTSEWSDVSPANFFSAPNITAVPLGTGNPPQIGANSALYAVIGNNGDGGQFSLHLLYDFLPRTPAGGPLGQNGEIFATVKFPIHVPQQFRNLGTGAEEQDVSVIFQGLNPSAAGGGGLATGFFDVFVDLDFDGVGDLRASQLGLIGAADFGPSPLSLSPHLIVELGVSLRIPAGFADPAGPLPGGGINPATGLYEPDPAFWGAAGGGNGGAAGAAGGGAGENLQSASNANFTINPNGSTSVVAVPEPASTALLVAGLSAFVARRRRKTAE